MAASLAVLHCLSVLVILASGTLLALVLCTPHISLLLQQLQPYSFYHAPQSGLQNDWIPKEDTITIYRDQRREMIPYYLGEKYGEHM